ncbi:uncharacterized protein LOC135338887 [Halichondria panicea]|uniref:uncharacterized protein LOC135338887 n=1 Tax=Halichondria panicea TaxID=6063 RepID=UPI00312BBD1A
MELVEVCRDSQTKAVVNLHGATLQSWINNGEEMIFVSKDAVFNNVKAIRGGIPVVFPCFGAWDMGPQHGFARTSKWTCSKPPFMDESGNAVATFTLVDTEDTRKMWNGNKFEVNYTVVVKTDCLVTKFTVCNQNSMESFDFTCLLHTYFLLPDVSKTTISGLGGLLYVDKTDGGKEKTEESDPKTISQFTDSVYKNASKDHLLTNVAGGRTINIKKMNFPDTVVWNPWAEKAKAMADFGDDQYRNMV